MRLDQALVAGEAEDVVDVVFLAPRHQLVAAKPLSARRMMLDVGPALADLRDDARNLSLAPSAASLSAVRSLAASRCRPQKM